MCCVYQGDCIVSVVYIRVTVLYILDTRVECCAYQNGHVLYTSVTVLYVLCILGRLYCLCHGDCMVRVVYTRVVVLYVLCILG